MLCYFLCSSALSALSSWATSKAWQQRAYGQCNHSNSSSALQDSAGIIEKDDLIAKVKEVAAAGPEGEAPAGYSFDAATGYWHSAGGAWRGRVWMPPRWDCMSARVCCRSWAACLGEWAVVSCCCCFVATSVEHNIAFLGPVSPALQTRACTGTPAAAASTTPQTASGTAGTTASSSLWRGRRAGRSEQGCGREALRSWLHLLGKRLAARHAAKPAGRAVPLLHLLQCFKQNGPS